MPETLFSRLSKTADGPIPYTGYQTEDRPGKVPGGHHQETLSGLFEDKRGWAELALLGRDVNCHRYASRKEGADI